MTEVNERKARETNIVIYGLKETDSANKFTRLINDTQQVKNIMEVCEVEGNDEKIEKMLRLGRYDKDRQNRPLLVQLDSVRTKLKMFRGSPKLKDGDCYKEIRVTNDLTKSERENERKLFLEAKQLEEDSQGLHKFKVRGPPWQRHIIKTQ